MVGAMRAVEFAQDGSDGGAGGGGVGGDHQDFDPGSEDVGFLLLDRSPPAAGEQRERAPGRSGGSAVLPGAAMVAPATSKPVCCSISTRQVGLVTLISVRRSPMTSIPTRKRPAPQRTGPGPAMAQSAGDSGRATPVPAGRQVARLFRAAGCGET